MGSEQKIQHPIRHINTRIVKPLRIDQHPSWLGVYLGWIKQKMK